MLPYAPLLIGLLFNIVTFPGLLVNGVFQTLFEERYNVPLTTVTVDIDEQTLEDEFDDEEEIQEIKDALENDAEDGNEVVDYSAIDSYTTLFKLVLMPFFASSAVAVGLYAVIVVALVWGTIPFWILIWLAFSIAAQAFPNERPTDALYHRSKEDDSLLRFVGYPLVALSKLMAALRFLWADAVYALALWFLVTLVLGFPAGA